MRTLYPYARYGLDALESLTRKRTCPNGAEWHTRFVQGLQALANLPAANNAAGTANGGTAMVNGNNNQPPNTDEGVVAIFHLNAPGLSNVRVQKYSAVGTGTNGYSRLSAAADFQVFGSASGTVQVQPAPADGHIDATANGHGDVPVDGFGNVPVNDFGHVLADGDGNPGNAGTPVPADAVLQLADGDGVGNDSEIEMPASPDTSMDI